MFKFRIWEDEVWDEKTETFFGQYSFFDLRKLHSKRTDDGIFHNNEYLSLDLDPIEQFTNITDADKADIYVGDLFDVTLLEFGVKNPINLIGEVVSFRGCYMIKYTYQNKERYSDLYDFVDGNEKYIKGNIRENSDLLS